MESFKTLIGLQTQHNKEEEKQGDGGEVVINQKQLNNFNQLDLLEKGHSSLYNLFLYE